MRIEQLTFTRFIAAITIVVFHFGRKTFLWNNEYIGFFFKQANISVNYFFVLSGFILTIVYSQRGDFSKKKFYLNRFARIYPLYIIALLLVPIIRSFKSITFNELILNITMLQSWFPKMATTINYPGWSISVEVLFYISFPVIFKYLNKKNLTFKTITILVFWGLSQLVYHMFIYAKIAIPFYSISDMHYNPVLHLNEFLIGILAGFFFIKYNRRNSNNTCCIILVIISLIFLLKYKIPFSYHNGLLAIIFAILIYLISENSGKITAILIHKLPVYLGEISFAIYILQYPVYRGLTDYRFRNFLSISQELFDSTFAFFMRLIILIITSILAYEYIENPTKKILRNLVK